MNIVEILTLIGVVVTIIELVISAISLGFKIGMGRKRHHR